VRGLLFAVVMTLVSCTRVETEAVPHVKLGMAPKDVRDHFEPGGDGTWQTSVGKSADDTAIEWRAKDAQASKTKTARFEFHLGMLVAVRATTNDQAPSGEQVTATPTTVSVRRPATGGGTEIEVLARDCPTHKDEAERLAKQVK